MKLAWGVLMGPLDGVELMGAEIVSAFSISTRARLDQGAVGVGISSSLEKDDG